MIVLAVVFGGYLVAGALSGPTGAPLGFNGIVRLLPLSGWQTAGSGTGTLDLAGRPATAPFVLITRGNGDIALVVVPRADVAPGSIASGYIEDALRARLNQLSVSRELQPVTLSSGAAAARFTYVGVRSDTGASV